MKLSPSNIVSGAKRRIRKIRNLPPQKYDRFTKVQKTFFEENAELTIFDVGAHRGESISRFRMVFPNSVIHSFEADLDNFKRLEGCEPPSSKLLLNNFGVGAEISTATFHRNLKSDTSSFYQINPNSSWAKIRSAQYQVKETDFTEKSYQVPIRPLDDYIDEHNIDHIHILKIDTQGYEDKVLAGAQKALQDKKIDMIETVLIVGDVYKHSLSFYYLEQYLRPCGFRFFAIDTAGDLMRHPSLSFNLIYVRDDLIKAQKLAT